MRIQSIQSIQIRPKMKSDRSHCRFVDARFNEILLSIQNRNTTWVFYKKYQLICTELLN